VTDASGHLFIMLCRHQRLAAIIASSGISGSGI